jgi:ribosomal protein L30E
VVAKGGGSFCKDVAKTMNDAGSAGSAGTSLDQTKALVQKGLAEAAILAAEAPNEIKSDVAVLAAQVAALYSAVQKANYDFTKVDPSTLTAMNTPAVKAAEAKVDAYVKVKCGIDVGADASS